jgi:linoleoyl-CoA desaturase
MQKPKFISTNPDFFTVLKAEVNSYFESNLLERTGGMRILSKAAFLLSILVILYIHLVVIKPNIWIALLECVLLGVTASAIGFNVMHDGAHGSFSDKKWINKWAARTLDLLGASSFMWNSKHNVIHHTYTNVEGVDDDINVRPYLRMAKDDPKYWIHKFQHYYFIPLYSLLYLFWVFTLDYKKYFTGKIGEIRIAKMSKRDHITFWIKKLIHLVLFVVIPIISYGFLAWLIGYLVFSIVTGFVISTVFQLAHTVELTSFVQVEGTPPVIENDWAIHQINTTANFSTKSKFVNWFTGGLNFQIEHHLFPKISHIHYPKISEIVKNVCQQYSIQYNEFQTLIGAVKSHRAFLKSMGTA